MKVRRTKTALALPQGKARSLELLRNLLALTEGLAEAEEAEEVVPEDWAQQVVNALLNRIMHRMPKAGSKDAPGEQCLFTGLNRGSFTSFSRFKSTASR